MHMINFTFIWKNWSTSESLHDISISDGSKIANSDFLLLLRFFYSAWNEIMQICCCSTHIDSIENCEDVLFLVFVLMKIHDCSPALQCAVPWKKWLFLELPCGCWELMDWQNTEDLKLCLLPCITVLCLKLDACFMYVLLKLIRLPGACFLSCVVLFVKMYFHSEV